MDLDLLIDTSQDGDPDGVVRWVASQSPNPALQALMKEAEREKRTRPSTPIHGHAPRPLSSTASSTPLSTSASAWHSSGDFLPLSSSSSSASLPRGSDPSVARRAYPLSASQRKLAPSTSSAKQPLGSSGSSTYQTLRNSARQRSSSHSTAPSTYIPQEEEPEALTFIELLKDVSKKLDENAQKKQRLAARAREQERSLGRRGTDNRTGLDVKHGSARPLIKTSSASAVCPVGSSTRATESPPEAFRHQHRGRVLTKTASLGAPDVDLVSGKSTQNSLPNPNLNCNPKHALTYSSHARGIHPTAARNTHSPEPTSDDDDSPMQGVIDLTETDTEWERRKPHTTSLADTTMYMQVDNGDDDDLYGDTGMDVSFYQTEPHRLVAALKPKPQPPQPNTASRTPAPPMQRACSGPPPLGMRRAPQLQSTQYNSTQISKGLTVPRFKPPSLVNAGVANKTKTGTKPAATTSSKQPPRGGAAKVAATKTAVQEIQDADSSFDVSFDVDPDKLEATMRAYDRI